MLREGGSWGVLHGWRIVPKRWAAVLYAVDHRDMDWQFSLTGSAVRADRSTIHHTGTGRFSWVLMLRMSLWESGESTGQIRLSELFQTPQEIGAINRLDLKKIAFLTCRGGWPRATYYEDEIALEQAYDYYDAIVNTDISSVDGVARNAERVKALMRSYARNQGTQISNRVLRDDLAVNDVDQLDVDTVYSYITALKKIFVIEAMAAWHPNLRSKTAVRTSDTRYFVDSSFVVEARGMGPEDLSGHIETSVVLFGRLSVLCAHA